MCTVGPQFLPILSDTLGAGAGVPWIAAAIKRAMERVHIRVGAGGYGAWGGGAVGATGDAPDGLERGLEEVGDTFGTRAGATGGAG